MRSRCEWWIVDGVLSAEPVADAETVFDGGWIVPGLVDAHCHVGLGAHGPIETSTSASSRPRPNAGSARCCCATAGRRSTPAASTTAMTCPASSAHGRHLARPKRYQRGFAIELEDESQLPDAVAEQARWGDGWVKLVGDWIDRDVGDLAPLWSDDVLKAAMDAAHADGARVTAHVFSEDALPGLINAGIDCIEHGTGLTDDTVELMVEHGTALVPTLINIENFPGIADGGRKVSGLRAGTCGTCTTGAGRASPPRAKRACRSIAGTDAGSMVAHGRIADEIDALKRIGMTPTEALGAASWTARGLAGQARRWSTVRPRTWCATPRTRARARP